MAGKRIFDVVFAAAALIVFSPVLLFIALAVLLDSRGTILYRQIRVGKGEVPFTILKFRSMRNDATGTKVTAKGDPRITNVGAFLRRYKLDELPQFLNVLRGDMSIIGPRPEVPQYVAHWLPEDRALILSVRPGMTDATTLEFYDEEAMLAQAP